MNKFINQKWIFMIVGLVMVVIYPTIFADHVTVKMYLTTQFLH